MPRIAHGMSGTKLYFVWNNMLQRTTNPNRQEYPRYGGRGVRAAREFHTFIGFRDYILTHLGPPPTPKHSLDRIDPCAGYVRGNLRWATAEEQANNLRTVTRYPYKGQLLTLSQIAKRKKVQFHTLRKRIRELGWDVEDALAKPVRNWRAA